MGDINFIKQCHVLSLIQLELKSMTKETGLYAVNGVYHVTRRGVEAAGGPEPLMLPNHDSSEVPVSTCTSTGAASAESKHIFSK